MLQAGSRVQNGRSIRCQLENIAGLTTGGASTLLTVLPEGTAVKQGDVLATFDKSNYEEMLRQQEISVEQAKASRLQASLNLEIAQLAVIEFRDGTVEETLKGMEGSLALARSNLSLAMDHLSWSREDEEKRLLVGGGNRLGEV